MRVIEIKNGEVVEVGNSSATTPPLTQRQANKNQNKPAKNNAFEMADDHQSSMPEFDAAEQLAGQFEDRQASNGKRRNKKDKGSYDDVYGRAVYLLAMRDHSRHELFTKLSQKFPSSTHINDVVDALVEQRFLDDSRFVEAYLRMRMARGVGPLKVSAELRGKGVEDQLISQWVVFDDDAWKEGARTAYNKKYGAAPITDFQEWSKRARFLQGRGFSRQHFDAVLPEY